ncbi:Pentatricopeptide repeat-containing protein [Drosera capensis]
MFRSRYQHLVSPESVTETPLRSRGCGVLNEVGLGREVHCNVLRNGYGGNVFVQSALVDFYCKIGRVGVARHVLDEMSEPDLVAWNAFVAGCWWNGLDCEAVGAVREVWMKGLRPNASTLASVVPVCGRLGYLDVGKSLHCYAMKTGFHLDELMSPALISLYGSNGDVIAARRLFDLSSVKSTVMWNSIINVHVQNLQPVVAHELFHHMLLAGFQPDRATFLSVIPCCEDLSGLSHSECIHVCAIKAGVESQAGVATTLISMYAKLGYLDAAKLVLDDVPDKDLLTWNSMISAYARNGDWVRTFASVRKLQSAGYFPDSISLISVLSSCCELEALLLGKSVHAFSIRKGLDSHLNLLNLLLAFYSRCHQLAYSFRLFETMDDRDSVSWNTMISGCVRNGENQKAVSLIQQMQHEGTKLDLVSLISILPSFNSTETNGLAQGMAVHGYAVKSGFASDVPLANAMITMYSNCDGLTAPMKLFNTMRQRCVVSWNSLMSAFLDQGLLDDVIALFRRMLNHNQKPDHVTLLNVVRACSNLLQGKSMHAFAVRTRAVIHTLLVSSMMFMYSRFGETASCFLLFESGDKQNISIWNAMISILVGAGEAQHAFGFFRDLLWTQLRPDHVTILGLVSACLQLNTVGFCHPILAFVIKKGFGNDVATSNALINLYAKCGDMAFARKLFEETPSKNSISWNIMISSYGSHGDGGAAVTLFWDMLDSGFRPEGATYLSVLSACSHSGLMEHTSNVLKSMLVNGTQPTMEHYACVLDLLCRTGELSEAYDMVRRLIGGASTSMLESLLGACMHYGNVELGIKLGELVIESAPDDAGSYVMLHNMYAAAGRYGDADRVRAHLEKRRLRKVVGFSFLDH